MIQISVIVSHHQSQIWVWRSSCPLKVSDTDPSYSPGICCTSTECYTTAQSNSSSIFSAKHYTQEGPKYTSITITSPEYKIKHRYINSFPKIAIFVSFQSHLWLMSYDCRTSPSVNETEIGTCLQHNLLPRVNLILCLELSHFCPTGMYHRKTKTCLCIFHIEYYLSFV